MIAVAVRRRLEALGYRPGTTSHVLLRFEGSSERWPDQSGVAAEWLLHTQLDELDVDPHGFPRDVVASLTLFRFGAAELHTRCRVSSDEHRAELRSPAWVDVLKRCAKALLAPFEDGAQQRSAQPGSR